MTDLPPLNSVKICTKCGTEYTYSDPKPGQIHAMFMPGMEWHGATSPQTGRPCCCLDCHFIEHQSRSCLQCGFRWAEACYQPDQMDKKPLTWWRPRRRGAALE